MKKHDSLKTFSIYLLRGSILCMGVGALLLCALVLPRLWQDIDNEFPAYSYAVYAVFITMYITTIPYYVGLIKGWQLLDLIRQSHVFSAAAVNAVKVISFCAGMVSLCYILCLPFFYIWGDNDDAPGLIVIGMFLVGIPMVVSVFAALLQQLLHEAVNLKAENDLTV